MKFFLKQKSSGKTSKPTESESLVWKSEIDIHKKFHWATDVHLALRTIGLTHGWPPQFWQCCSFFILEEGPLILSVMGASGP